jgi:hypothetical protein
MGRGRLRFSLAASALVASGGCAMLAGLEDHALLPSSTDDAGPLQPPAVDASDAAPDAAIQQASPADGDADVDGGIRPRCPSGKGPAMVEIPLPGDAGSFCIDRTEVTQAQYAAFLATSPGATQQDGRCKDINGAFAPDPANCPEYKPQERANHPMVCVDWCDAYAFCKWAGKRLCGTFQPAGAADAAPPLHEWILACTRGGDYPYPYGAEVEPTTCNSSENGRGGTVEVGSLPGCRGGYDGLVDMTGNVWEFEDSCGSVSPWYCDVRGGDFTETARRCDHRWGVPHTTRERRFGIRCCAGVTP